MIAAGPQRRTAILASGHHSSAAEASTNASATEYLAREREAFAGRTPRSAERYARALRVMPGGDTRAATFYPPYPVGLRHGEGVDIQDLDGNGYVDFLLNYTSLILGHRHPAVLAAVDAAVAHGTAFAAPVPGQVELAETLVERVPSVERVRFVNSGTEATTSALWAARAFTGRRYVVKAIGGYHGSAPELDKAIRPGSFPAGVPDTSAVRAVRYNDADALERAIEQGDVAAVVLEPVMGAAGVVLPAAGYLARAQAAARRAGALFILDEVITFRLGRGGYQGLAGLEPDLTAFAKIIGGGFPVGAVGGRADAMEVFAPGASPGVIHSGTFNGNPVTVAAGLRTLELLDDDVYARLDRLGSMLAEGLRDAIRETGAPAQVTHVGSLVNLHFTERQIVDADIAAAVDPVAAAAFHLGLLNRGIFIATRGLFALSAVTDERHVRRAVDAATDVLQSLTKG
jgi:glutamate-1-semialdehyde 2,1-aminomutase